MSSTERKKRKAYSVNEKLDAVALVSGGTPQRQAAKDLGIPKETLRGWLKIQKKLQASLDQQQMQEEMKRKRTRPSYNDLLDSTVYAWYQQQRQIGAPLSGSIVKQTARHFARAMDPDSSFAASKGWLWRWQKRHGVGQLARKEGICSQEHNTEAEFPVQQIAEDGSYFEEDKPRTEVKNQSPDVPAKEDQECEAVDEISVYERSHDFNIVQDITVKKEVCTQAGLPQLSEIISSLETALRWFKTQRKLEPERLLQFKSMIDFARKKRNDSLNQRTISDFFC
ncbi:UNVERIFIED_CONTAM: hypothetical protein FKN15_025216 [Acipenser sinensis]